MSMNPTNTKNIPKTVLAQYLPPHPIIIEAGAHIGRDTIKMVNLWSTSIIHAFEPVPALFEQLTAKAAQYPSIHCYQLALSNQSGTSTFFMSSGRSTATSSLLEPTTLLSPAIIFDPIEVTTVTLDEWARKNVIHSVDFLWLDMQGAELKALQGGTTLLKTVHAIYTEVNLVARYKKAPLYLDIKEWLQAQRFTVALEAFDGSDWGNVLFIKQR